MKQKAYPNKSILLISDTHFPYAHPKLFEFLKNIKNTFKPDRVFHLGDLTDQYMFSSYSKIPEADNTSVELTRTRKQIKQLGALFPDMILMSSNHDDRIYKRSRIGGVPKELLLPYNKMIGADNFNWKWVQDYTIRLPNKRHLYMCHTRAGTAQTVTQILGMSVAVGHHHNQFGIRYTATPRGDNFSIDCGCLIDDDSYAFAYNRQSIIRPMLGCSIIIESEPFLLPFKEYI